MVCVCVCVYDVCVCVRAYGVCVCVCVYDVCVCVRAYGVCVCVCMTDMDQYSPGQSSGREREIFKRNRSGSSRGSVRASARQGWRSRKIFVLIDVG